MNKENIYEFLNSWKDGVIEIGSVYKSDGNYKKEAAFLLISIMHLMSLMFFLSQLLPNKLFLEITKKMPYHISLKGILLKTMVLQLNLGSPLSPWKYI